MTVITEHFIKGADNQITLTLTEDGTAISGAWTQLDIWIGSLRITRTSDGGGVTLNTTTGRLTINPADLTEDLGSLVVGEKYRVQIVITDATNDDGAVFGGSGSDQLTFIISEKPS